MHIWTTTDRHTFGKLLCPIYSVEKQDRKAGFHVVKMSDFDEIYVEVKDFQFNTATALFFFYINTVRENSRNSTNLHAAAFDKRPLFKFIHVWLIHDSKQTLENNCLLVVNDRCLPDMRLLIENSPVFIDRYWELFLVWNLMRFHASLLVKSGNSSQSKKAFSFSSWKVHFPLWYCTLLILWKHWTRQ